MALAVPTVKVRIGDEAYIINQSDFDSAVHELFDASPARKNGRFVKTDKPAEPTQTIKPTDKPEPSASAPAKIDAGNAGVAPGEVS